MTTVTSKSIAKVAAIATGLAMATSMLTLTPVAYATALTTSQVNAIISLLQSFGADANTIANVQASLTGGTPTGTTGGTTTTTSSCTFTRDLTVGVSGTDVTCLQQALMAAGYNIPALAAGTASYGYFGGQTKTAVVAWQKAAGVSPTSGYFGPISRAHWNLGGGSTTGGNTGGNTGTTPTGAGLKVSLSATSPSGSVLVAGQAIGDLGDYTFTNPTSAPINVTGLTFNRTGVSNDSTLTNIYLYSGATRLTDSVGISNSQFMFSDPTALFTVPAGGTYTVSVRSDIVSGSSGQQVGVSLVSVSSNGTLDSSVAFPINSGYQTISAASLAGVDYSSTVSPSDTTISPQSDYPVWQDTISVNTNPVKLESMRFTNLGSIDSSDVTNLRLYVDGTMVGSAVPAMAADRSVTFDLSASPVTLSTSSHVIKVLANVTGGASRTIKFSIQRASDGMFVDSQLNQPVTPTKAGSTFSSVTAGQVTINSVNGTSGVSVSLDPSSPNADIAYGATNVQFASFDMLASGENTKVSDLYVYAADSVHTTGGLKNGKIMVNGVQVGSTKDIGYNSSNYTDFSLGSSLILPAGQTTVVSVYADAKTSTSTNLSNNETVQVSLHGAVGLGNAQGMSSLNSADVPSSDVSGNSVTVSSSSLVATKYSGYGDQTLVKGTTNAKLGSFTLSTGSTEGVTVNTIVLTMSSANAASITNLVLKDDATGNVLGSVIASPSSSNSFAVNVDIPSSSTKTFDVYGNILSSANNGSIQLSLGSATAGNGDTTGTLSQPSTTALQTISLGAGSLYASVGAGDPTSDNILAGASNVHVGQFQFSATNSSYTVQNLAILIPNNAATSVTNVTLQYTDVNGAQQTVTKALQTSSTAAYATAAFTGLTMYVPANDSSNLDVYVGTPTTASGATSGTGIQVTLSDANTGNTFRAVNSAGSSLSEFNGNTTNMTSNGTHYVRKSIPTFAMINTNLSVPSTGSPLYKFSITADPAGAIEWSKLVFNIATSGTATDVKNVYLTDDSSGVNLLDNKTSSASTTATSITVNLLKNSTQPQYQQVAAGATKTYDLYGTVSGFTTGSTVTISLASDGSHVANAAAGSVAGNVVWSDRSANNHTTSSTDWTNGYLLKDFTSNAISYSK